MRNCTYLHREGFSDKAATLPERLKVGQEAAVRAGHTLAPIRLGHFEQRVRQLQGAPERGSCQPRRSPHR